MLGHVVAIDRKESFIALQELIPSGNNVLHILLELLYVLLLLHKAGQLDATKPGGHLLLGDPRFSVQATKSFDRDRRCKGFVKGVYSSLQREACLLSESLRMCGPGYLFRCELLSLFPTTLAPFHPVETMFTLRLGDLQHSSYTWNSRFQDFGHL